MGFAQGVQAGKQAAAQWGGTGKAKTNPYAAMGAIETTLKQLNKRMSPAVIRNNAASMANQERQLDLQERQQQFVESQAALAEDKRRWAIEEQTGQGLKQDAAAAQKGLIVPGEEYRKEAGELRTQEKHDVARGQVDQAEDFKIVQWAVANRQAGPIVEFINKYGGKSANLRGMSWNEKGEVLVFPENEKEKPGYFKNNEELMRSFVGFMNPKVESQMAKMAREEAGQKLKGREQDRKDYATYDKDKVEGKGAVTPSQHRMLRNDARKRYKEKYHDALGKATAGAPDEEAWVTQEVGKEIDAMGGKGVAKGAQQAISEKGEAEVERFRDPKTGNTMVVHPDGRREVLDKKGDVIATRGGKGAKEAVKSDAMYGRNVEGVPAAMGSIPKDRGKAASKDVPEKAEKKAASSGSATYTDPKTGKKMKATMGADGTITTEEVDDSKKKRKKGYGEKGYKPKSINK